MRHVLLILLIAVPLHAQTVRSIHPRPRVSWELPGEFVLDRWTALIVPANPSQATIRAAGSLQSLVRGMIGDTLDVIPEAMMSGRTAIYIGEYGSYPVLTDQAAASMAPGEPAPAAQGYLLDVTAGRVILAGGDGDGTFAGVSTLFQLLRRGTGSARIACAHVNDRPDYPIRWVFATHNLRGPNAITALRGIADTMAMHKLNGFMHSDFKYGLLAAQPPWYFDSVRAFKALCEARNLSITPGVANIGYSSSILWNDPHLAEGVPAGAAYVIDADTGRIIPDARVALPNGSFETVNGGTFTGWSFYDGPGVSIVPDRAVFHGGTTSARCENFRQGNTAGNARFNRLVDCQPFRCYIFSAYVRTQNLDADAVQLLALGMDSSGGYRPLTYTEFSIPATTGGWKRVEVVFNTLTYSRVLLYAGVWGGNGGTIWWDDIAVRDAGWTNVLRRAGTPVSVRGGRTGATYAEGIDFAPLVDPAVDASHGNFGPYHEPPAFRRLPGGALRNGDTVRVTWYHPLTTVADADGNGSVMVCVSEDTLYALLADQAARLDTMYAPGSFFMGHDEIRTMNWDEACRSRGLTPAQLLADNVRRSQAIIRAVHPDARTFVWSDMFDSLHNARNAYYLVNGDLRGIWDLIPKDLIIANWNGGAMRQSLSFFASRGFSQITSPYYDVGNTSTIRGWRLAMEGVNGVLGSMYTTWANDFRFLAAFGDYLWTAGPFVEHRPLDAAVLAGDTLVFAALVEPDRWDATDTIASVSVEIRSSSGAVTSAALHRASGDAFRLAIPNAFRDGFTYTLTATNAQGLARVTPAWIVGHPAAPPDTVTLLRPANGATGVPLASMFAWTPAPRAASYDIQWSLRDDFAAPIEAAGPDTTALSALNAAAATHYWRVRGRNTAGAGPWSAVWRFVTEDRQNSIDAPETRTFRIGQNYPNPFRQRTRVPVLRDADARGTALSLAVYDVYGRTVHRGGVAPGAGDAEIDLSALPDGAYLCVMSAGGIRRSMVMTKSSR